MGRIGGLAGSALTVGGVALTLHEFVKVLRGTGTGAIELPFLKEKFIYDPQKYFQQRMLQQGIDVTELEGKTIEIDGHSYIIQNGIPIEVGARS